jgi:hypothetical protein
MRLKLLDASSLKLRNSMRGVDGEVGLEPTTFRIKA